MGDTEDGEVSDTSLLTSFNANGEYTSDTLSELREWLLRASATPSNVGYPRDLTGVLAPRL